MWRSRLTEPNDMILIMSVEYDHSTNGVLDWLHHLNRKFVRINPSDVLSEFHIDEELCCSFKVNDKVVNLRDVTSFWYRRGHLNMPAPTINLANFPFNVELNKHLKAEHSALVEFVLKSLADKGGVGDYYKKDVNKFEVLEKARRVGLTIPHTIVTSNKEDVHRFFEKHGPLITKSNADPMLNIRDGFSLVSYTREIGLDEINAMHDYFAPSLFQKMINKKYELRIFFIDDLFYSMAIFSQLDEQTKVDFRRYNEKKPNRVVPHTLPDSISSKLRILMRDCGFNSGSIDMVYSISNEFIFLEVNPVGQFDWVAVPCNYYLQKTIAESLINN